MRQEPGWVDYQRDEQVPILEPAGMTTVGTRHYVVQCLVGGTHVVLIRWEAHNIDDARRSFKQWLTEEWCTLTTDFHGNPVPNGYDFKPAVIDRFAVVG